MTLETTVVSADPGAHPTPLLIVIVAQGPKPESLAALDDVTGGAIGRLYGAEAFAGKRDQTVTLYPSGPAERVIVSGAGKGEDIDVGAIRRAAGAAARLAAGMGVEAAAIYCSPEVASGIETADVAQAITEGVHFGAWRFDEFKEPPREEKAQLQRVELLADGDANAMSTGHRIGEAIGQGQTAARNLQMTPGNACTPATLAAAATDMAKRHGFEVTVLDRKGIEAEGLGGLEAVSRGSVDEPRFIVLEHRGAEGAPIVLVGKGVTFDTGGISLKPPANMEEMKYDMSGAAAVLGAFETIGRLKPNAHVVGLVPATDNMPSGSSFKPGDVIRSHSGKTIEIVNTDAEGRLILSDALSYARRFKPACVLDAATLTGAVVIALGHVASGVMGTDEALIEEVQVAGRRSGERVWPLPLWDEYRDLIKSDVADIKNSGGRPAGTISAGWFLREFVDGYPWAHIDIAGTAYTDRSPIMGKGPTGVGVRLFSEFVLARQS